MRPARQSAFACSSRSFEDETKFQYRKRSPNGSPPSSMTIDGASAERLAEPGRMMAISPAAQRCPHLDGAGCNIKGALR
jgi:hypothetical protein